MYIQTANSIRLLQIIFSSTSATTAPAFSPCPGTSPRPISRRLHRPAPLNSPSSYVFHSNSKTILSRNIPDFSSLQLTRSIPSLSRPPAITTSQDPSLLHGSCPFNIHSTSKFKVLPDQVATCAFTRIRYFPFIPFCSSTSKRPSPSCN